MQKSSTLFLSLLVTSGLLLNACSTVEENPEIEEAPELEEVQVIEEEEEAEEELPVADAEPIEEAETPVEEESKHEEMEEVMEEMTMMNDYKNGNYLATGNYQSPAGSESISVSLTIEDDIVTAVTVSSLATDDTSIQFQTKFIGGVSTQVIGMDMDQLNVGNTAGSSLTPSGFNNALANIKAQAAS